MEGDRTSLVVPLARTRSRYQTTTVETAAEGVYAHSVSKRGGHFVTVREMCVCAFARLLHWLAMPWLCPRPALSKRTPAACERVSILSPQSLRACHPARLSVPSNSCSWRPPGDPLRGALCCARQC